MYCAGPVLVVLMYLTNSMCLLSAITEKWRHIDDVASLQGELLLAPTVKIHKNKQVHLWKNAFPIHKRHIVSVYTSSDLIYGLGTRIFGFYVRNRSCLDSNPCSAWVNGWCRGQVQRLNDESAIWRYSMIRTSRHELNHKHILSIQLHCIGSRELALLTKEWRQNNLKGQGTEEEEKGPILFFNSFINKCHILHSEYTKFISFFTQNFFIMS